MITILILQQPSYVPSFYLDNEDRLFLDLFADTEVELTSKFGQDIGSITSDAVLEIDIPATKKNRFVFDSLGFVNGFNVNHSRKSKIEISNGGLTISDRTIQITGVNETAYTVLISGKVNAWIDDIKNKKIAEVDLGAYEFTVANITDTWQNNAAYKDNGSIVFLPLVNYGRWNNEGSVTYEELRPFLSPLGILQKAFCEAGFKFRCPLLETNRGRRRWCYLLKPNYADQATDLQASSFRASNTAPIDINGLFGPLVFDDDFTPPNFDTGNNYDNTTGRYRNDGVTCDFTFIGRVDYFHSTGANLNVAFQWRKRNTITGQSTDLNIITIDLVVNGTTAVQFSALDVELTAGDEVDLLVFPSISSGTTTMQINTGSYIFNLVKKAKLGLGDNILLQNIVDTRYTVYNFLKGIVHLYNLKTFTDEISKTVWFLPEDQANWYGDALEGYFKENNIDWTAKVNQRSYTAEIEKELSRTFRLGFKESTDNYINSLSLDNELYTKELDQGDDFEVGITEDRNPFFEPTFNALDTSIGVNVAGVGQSGAYIPFMWDADLKENNTRPEPAQNIAPRIIIVKPYGQVGLQPDITGLPGTFIASRWFLTDTQAGTTTEQTLQNLSFQVCSIDVLYADPAVSPVLDIVDEGLAYDISVYRPDLEGGYEIFYQDSIDRLYFALTFELTLYLQDLDISKFSHRDLIYLNYLSRFGNLVGYFRVLEYRGYTLNQNQLTRVSLTAQLPPVRETC